MTCINAWRVGERRAAQWIIGLPAAWAYSSISNAKFIFLTSPTPKLDVTEVGALVLFRPIVHNISNLLCCASGEFEKEEELEGKVRKHLHNPSKPQKVQLL